MNNLSRSAKFIAFLSITACAIWIGSYLTRLMLVYNLFEGTELQLKPYINDHNLSGILLSFVPSILTHFISYIIFIIVFITFLLISKLSLKQNGWLFIILVVVIVTLPFEVYLMNIDYKTVSLLLYGNFNSSQILDLLRERIKVLSSFPIVILLSYISFFYFIIFRPLTKKL